MYEEFLAHAKKVVEEFSTIPQDETIRVVSHFDCDGICSCALLLSALNKAHRKYTISILKQLDEKALQTLSQEEYSTYVFTDLGSGQYPLIQKHLSGKNVFILDHHELEGCTLDNRHLNPHFFDIDGAQEVSGAGVVYFFCKAFDETNTDMAHIAIVGATGDVQTSGTFLPLNQRILDDAVSNNIMKVVKELKLYGRETRPLYKALEYCSDPFIPGVSGSESGAINLLHTAGINPKRGSQWKKYTDLTDGEKQRLSSAVILRRLDEENPEDIFGMSYILLEEEPGSPFRDVKEFSTLLNACGRMGKASLGIGACLGIKAMKRKALLAHADYKKEIVKAMKWYESTEDVERGEGYIIINARENVMATMIGTMASIISKSGKLSDGTFILSLARSDNNMTKVSIRVAGIRTQPVDLRSIVTEITDTVGGESGGHSYAAGAIIPVELEEKFVEQARDVLAKRAVEEKVA